MGELGPSSRDSSAGGSSCLLFRLSSRSGCSDDSLLVRLVDQIAVMGRS
jgi:hypothetical protein